MGPVIDAEARNAIEEYHGSPRRKAAIVAKIDVAHLADRGHYVGPMVVADVEPDVADRPARRSSGRSSP